MDNNLSNIKERILYFAEYKRLPKESFFKEIGMTYGSFKGIQKKTALNSDAIDKLLSIHGEIDANWLLTGRGAMLKNEPSANYLIDDHNNLLEEEQTDYAKRTLSKSIPLIPIDAMAGFGSGDIQVHENDISEYYEVPLFERRGAKYLISVAGNSMYPKYASGDLLACKPLKDLTFVQWGKPYVLDTEQGAIVKRLFESPTDKDVLICKSDNNDFYPPFAIHKKSIYKVAIVVGVLRLE